METLERKRLRTNLDPVIAELSKSDKISALALVECLVRSAHATNASDVHFDPNSHNIAVRFRIDGILEDRYLIPLRLHAELLARLKILAGLRTDEHFTPHDGRFRFHVSDSSLIDVRVSITPTYYGENAVLRLLSPFQESDNFAGLGYSPEQEAIILQALSKPHGMILATGPTGSGKTTSMYAFIKALNTRARSIITIEDPIEYSVSGINQIQVNARNGLSFAQGLRSILRQDPNVIMVGEVRDQETAALAVNAALTGHVVLSTLHTNDAATTLPRLLDMRIEPYLIASTVSLIIAQRLVRRVCPNCIVPQHPTGIELQALSELLPDEVGLSDTFFIGAGCADCGDTGYQGRVGIFELLSVDATIRNVMGSKRSVATLRALARKNGMIPMFEDGYAKAIAGVTTLQEVLRMQYE